MPLSWKSLAALFATLSLASPAFPQAAAKKKPATPPAHSAAAPAQAPAPLTERQRALHALNRLTFGPRPGDLEAVLAKGVDNWIEDQLHPESIGDSAAQSRLNFYRSTLMNPRQLTQAFPPEAVLQNVANGKRPMPDDPVLHLVYSVQVARIKQQRAAQAAAAKPPAAAPAAGAADAAPAAPTPQDLARGIADKILILPKNERLKALEDAPPDQLINFPNTIRPDQRARLLADFSTPEREAFYSLNNPTAVVATELQQAKILREALSERQLLEVMTDFWFNHFNVFQYKDRDSYLTTGYERDAIRAHALGKFRDLLGATAQHPAMLFYLDNWLSIGPQSAAAGKGGQSGLNENYGRELMELHTLGVDGGYTQADVTEAARVFTGWTIANLDDGGQFQFDPRRHEPGNKKILGKTFYESGVDEGQRLLDMLASHPSTAHFISKKLAMRFVSDDPPEALVKRMAATFLATDGDIREVLRTLFKSPEFWSPKVYRGKVKTPLEFVVSALRASGTEIVLPDSSVGTIASMGMPPYGCVPPTGYSMAAEAWENQGDLLARFNFATNLTQNKVAGLTFDPANLLMLGLVKSPDLPKTRATMAGEHTGVDLAIALIEDALLQGDFSPANDAVVRQQLQDPDVARQMAASPISGLRLVSSFVLASPDFQHR